MVAITSGVKSAGNRALRLSISHSRPCWSCERSDLDENAPAVERQQEQQASQCEQQGVGARRGGTRTQEAIEPVDEIRLEEDARARASMHLFTDGGMGRIRIGTSMTVLMYALPPLLRQLKTNHPQLEINLKSNLTATTLRVLKENELDLGLCAMPVTDAAFEVVPLFRDWPAESNRVLHP